MNQYTPLTIWLSYYYRN